MVKHTHTLTSAADTRNGVKNTQGGSLQNNSALFQKIFSCRICYFQRGTFSFEVLECWGWSSKNKEVERWSAAAPCRGCWGEARNSFSNTRGYRASFFSFFFFFKYILNFLTKVIWKKSCIKNTIQSVIFLTGNTLDSNILCFSSENSNSDVT